MMFSVKLCVVGEADINSVAGNVTRAGLILTGGGARAAYQVGVLKALSEIHPRPDWPFPIIVGTSAGAVAAAILAGNVLRWHQTVSDIEQVWANFRVHQVFRSDAFAMLKAGGRWMGSLLTGGAMGPPRSLLDNSPLRALLAKVTDFDAIRANVARGDLRALALCSTSYFTARSVSFFEAETTVERMVARAASRRTRAAVARLSDGESRHTVPVPADVPAGQISATARCARLRRSSPAIHLGADACWSWACARRISISFRASSPPTRRRRRDSCLATCSTLFSDQISADLENLHSHRPAVGTGRKRGGYAPDPDDDDRAERRPLGARAPAHGCVAGKPARADAHHRRARRHPAACSRAT